MGKVFKILFLAILIASVTDAFALNRCKQYIPEIRKWNEHYFGFNYPYHYAVGQAQQESNCRGDVTSFDGGEGLFQFTGSTKNWTREQMHESLNFYNPSNAIKAGAWYMSRIHKGNIDPQKLLFLDYMSYNGGAGNVKKEYINAGCPPACYLNMKAVCKRKTITLKNGSPLSFCKVAYDYPLQVYKYGLQYKTFSYPDYRFW
jgi:hypothetical protein